MCFYLAMAGNESLSILTLFKPNASDLHAGGSGSKRGIHSAGLTTWPQSSFLLSHIHCGIKNYSIAGQEPGWLFHGMSISRSVGQWVD